MQAINLNIKIFPIYLKSLIYSFHFLSILDLKWKHYIILSAFMKHLSEICQFFIYHFFISKV